MVGLEPQVGARPLGERGDRAALSAGEQRGGRRGGDRPQDPRAWRIVLHRRDAHLVLIDQTEHGHGAIIDKRSGGAEGGTVDLLAAGRGDQGGARGAQNPPTGDGPLVLADETGHASHDEPEEHDRRRDDHEHVRVAATNLLGHLDHRRDERCAGQQREPERGEPRLAIWRGVLERSHRRMQSRGAPEQVEADPADIEDDLPVVVAVEGDQAVGEVGDQERDDAAGEQVEGRLTLARVQSQTDGGCQ